MALRKFCSVWQEVKGGGALRSQHKEAFYSRCCWIDSHRVHMLWHADLHLGFYCVLFLLLFNPPVVLRWVKWTLCKLWVLYLVLAKTQDYIQVSGSDGLMGHPHRFPIVRPGHLPRSHCELSQDWRRVKSLSAHTVRKPGREMLKLGIWSINPQEIIKIFSDNHV